MIYRRVFSIVEPRLRSAVKTMLLPAWRPITLALLALALWSVSVGATDLSKMNDVGLVSVLPVPVYLALIILTISFCLTLYQAEFSEWKALFQVALLILMLFGLASVIETVPRFGASWKHVGVIDMIARTGSVDPAIDAYNNWPGFFILGALFTKVAGLPNAIPLLSWASVFFNLLYILPLRMLMLSVVRDKRLVWLGIWFFYLANWVGQDYFSPQAFGYFLYMVIMGVLLTWFSQGRYPFWLSFLQRGPAYMSDLAVKIRSWLERAEQTRSLDGRNISSNPGERLGLLLIIVMAFLVLVASHQLTPFSILIGVAALVIFNRLSLRGLPMIMLILLGSWVSFMTVAYMSGHLSAMLKFFGQLSDTVSSNLTDRLSGSPGHVLVTRMRLMVTLLVWGLAFLGGLRRLRYGRLDLNHALLAAAPFPLIAMQSYGGELLMRIYLFALPFMVFFTAALFIPRQQARLSWQAIASVGVVSLVMLGLFLTVRYGNERSDNFTPIEYDAVQYVYDQAAPGSLLAASSTNMPIRYESYEIHDYLFLQELVVQGDVQAVIQAMERKEHPAAYLIITRSQRAYLEIFYDLPTQSWQQFEADLLMSGRFELIYSHQDASVFLLVDEAR